MTYEPQIMLVGAVAAVGVLHTMVPDHWIPITLVARQRNWTSSQTARAAFVAAIGHVASTLALGSLVWIAGEMFAARFGSLLDTASSFALVGFGIWFSASALIEQRHQPAHRFVHAHSHGGETHTHSPSSDPQRLREQGNRTALLLILGSSPMLEGVPAFFAAGKFGLGLIVVMGVVFGMATVVTYVLLCVWSAGGLRRLRFVGLERYGEVLSGSAIAVVGIAVWIWPII